MTPSAWLCVIDTNFIVNERMEVGSLLMLEIHLQTFEKYGTYIPRVVLAPRKLSDEYAWGGCMGGASWRIGEGGSPSGKIVWSEHDSAEEEMVTRRHDDMA
jgi:hypothetical protein